ncbi:hypothetical protein AB0K08_01140 [Citricoccus sp. NPDC055426]|uniref:hypothetical protein n=1 Tax=Citricoccus sp. NPDC055426 TaxID=3155536 RepID=UPI00344417F2
MAETPAREATSSVVIADLIEEYSKHLRHADLIRKAVDGQVGLDPPYPDAG